MPFICIIVAPLLVSLGGAWYNLGRDYAAPVRVTGSGTKYVSNRAHPPEGIVSEGHGIISAEIMPCKGIKP